MTDPQLTDLQKIMNRAINDPAYGKKLETNPAGAMEELGVQVTPQKVAALKHAVAALMQARAVFQSGPPVD